MNWRGSDENSAAFAGGARECGRADQGRQLRAAAERARADPAGEAAAGHGNGPPENHHVEPGGAGVLRPGAGADALVLGARGGAVVRSGGRARPTGADGAVGRGDGRGGRLASAVPARSARGSEREAAATGEVARAGG